MPTTNDTNGSDLADRLATRLHGLATRRQQAPGSSASVVASGDGVTNYADGTALVDMGDGTDAHVD